MSVRALWVVSRKARGEEARVRYSRRYPTVEAQARRLNGHSYSPAPTHEELLRLIGNNKRSRNHHHHSGDSDDDIDDPDCCSDDVDDCGVGLFHAGLVASVHGQSAWPLLVTRATPEWHLVCLPLVEGPLEPRPPLGMILGVPQGLALLQGMAAFMVDQQQSKPGAVDAKVAQFSTLMMYACPFGRPAETDFRVLLRELATPSGSSGTSEQQQQRPAPAWRPLCAQRVKPLVRMSVAEVVRSVQYGRRDVPDVWEVYGSVECKCELDSTPDVSANLTLPANGVPLEDLLLHHCVLAPDPQLVCPLSVAAPNGGDLSFTGPYRFRFVPPHDGFALCSYTAQAPIPPVRGSFRLALEKDEDKEDNFERYDREGGDQDRPDRRTGEAGSERNGKGLALRLTLDLRLHETVKNSFDHFEARIPLANSGPITNVAYKVSCGQLEALRDQDLLIWTIGQRFPKSLEASLVACVGVSSEKEAVDISCNVLDSYVQLRFKIQDYTLTGCAVDPHSIQVQPPVKPKLITARELVSAEYIIWNKLGDAPIAYRPDAYA
ncbi:AP-5 complex subunit mu-1 [Petromyzon marinus]|uniref:AP-5 complex subunit mu-1 n=1 Tax=Petromyzon marinus TaxID=7757 RepID=A0AAJ7TMH6_PETMA|nr:AP-5 complex subunit mu-1 [Petromyzon marinus]